MIAREHVDRLVAEDPAGMAAWVQQHPLHLLLLLGSPYDAPPHIRTMLEDAVTYNTLLTLAPRDSAKTTTLAGIYPAWRALAWPENMRPDVRERVFAKASRPIDPSSIRIAVTSKSYDRAVSLLHRIRNILTQPRVERLFGDVAGSRWSEGSASTVYREDGPHAMLAEPTFQCYGVNSRVAGGHFDLFLMDDWVTEEAARTEHMRERLRKFYEFTVAGALESWSQQVVCGTRYHPADWYATVREWHAKGQWQHVRRFPAVVTRPDGTPASYWPSHFPLEALQARRAQIGDVAFSAQYQNELDLMLGSYFRPETLEPFGKWEELPQSERARAKLVLGLDPAFTAGPRSDFSAFVLLARIPNLPESYFVRRVWRGQFETPTHLVEASVALIRQHQPHVFAPEIAPSAGWLGDQLRKALREANAGRTRMLPVQPKRTGWNKEGRAQACRKFFDGGQVVLEEPTEENGVQRLLNELMAYPVESNAPGSDDCVDAFTCALLRSRGGGMRVGRLG